VVVIPMKSWARAMTLSLSVLFVQSVCAQEGERGSLLAEEMQFSKAFQDAIAVCVESAEQRNVENDVAKTPGLLGDIVPADKDWPEAKELYIRLLKAQCAYDPAPPQQAFARALGESLSASDIDALIAFYRSELGRRFVQASLAANNAANQANTPLPEAEGAYEDFGAAIQALLARRKPPDAPAVEKPRSVQAVASMDAAMSLSDRMMRGIVQGNVREAIGLALPHVVMTAEQMEALIQQIEQQKPIRDARYGASVDYELIRNDTIHDSLIRAIFLHRFERHAVVWQFVWYRGKDGWLLSNISYTDQLPQLFG
jgi:hypothetical protein